MEQEAILKKIQERCANTFVDTLDIKFIAPSRKDDELIGNVQILKKTKSMVFVNCALKKKDQLIASATGVWKVIKKI